MNGFALSPRDYIERLYQLVLGRAADQEGLAHWMRCIEEERDYSVVLKSLMESSEYQEKFKQIRRHDLTDRTDGQISIAYGDIGGLARGRKGLLRPDVELIVPVCNAEWWLEEVIEAYKIAKIDPLFIVDARSSDRSLEILISKNARKFTASGEKPYVESLLYEVIPYFDTKWVLRLDDDEIPSQDLLTWIDRELDEVAEPAVTINIGWIKQEPRTDAPIFSCTAANGAWLSLPTARLFQPKRVRAISDLHTPGIAYPSATRAPAHAMIYHLTWVFKDYNHRKRNIKKYDDQENGQGSNFTNFYLPEDHNPSYYICEPKNDALLNEICGRFMKKRIDLASARSDQQSPDH